MSARRLAALVAGTAAVVALGVLASRVLDTDAFRDAPDGFVTAQDGPLSFRHPPDWRVARTGVVLTARAPSGPGIVVVRRTGRSGQGALRELGRELRKLERGRRESITTYDLDLPGHGDVDVLDQVFLRSGGARERVESLVLPNGGGGIVHFAIRGPVSEDPATDPRAITGTLRLDG